MFIVNFVVHVAKDAFIFCWLFCTPTFEYTFKHLCIQFAFKLLANKYRIVFFVYFLLFLCDVKCAMKCVFSIHFLSSSSCPLKNKTLFATFFLLNNSFFNNEIETLII